MSKTKNNAISRNTKKTDTDNNKIADVVDDVDVDDG